MKDLMKLLEKKGMKPESEDKKMAKREVIEDLIAAMSEMIGDDMEAPMSEMPMMDKMQKVTVAAPDEEGLEEGLDKAREIVDMMPESDEMSDYDMEEEDEEDEY